MSLEKRCNACCAYCMMKRMCVGAPMFLHAQISLCIALA